MNVDAADRHDRQVGGESLDIDFVGPLTVEGIGHDGAELLQIDVVDTQTLGIRLISFAQLGDVGHDAGV